MLLPRLSENQLRRVRALRTRGMREKYGQFIIEGKRIADEALHSKWEIEFVCFSEACAATMSGNVPTTGKSFVLDDNTFAEISTTEHSQGVIAVGRIPAMEVPAVGNGFAIALDRVSDPGNVGTIIRTADWFGASCVILGKACAELYNPKTVRSTMGSLFHLPVYANVDLESAEKQWRDAGADVWCAETKGEAIGPKHRASERAMIIIGSEAHGISPALKKNASGVITVARHGHAESLNAATAAAAILALLRA